MERLWAPWRATYIEASTGRRQEEGGGGPESCVFCTELARGPAHHAETLILCVAPEAFVIMNRYPYNSGHVMVVPRAHVASPAELEPAAHDSFFRLVTAASGALTRALTPHGINMGMNLGRVAGAGVPGHCHMHLVPRWQGDNSFISVVGETRVISQDLAAAYAKLAPHFAPLAATP
jgi:ATP adenylyltransferase